MDADKYSRFNAQCEFLTKARTNVAKRKIEKGSTVHLVTAAGKHVAAKVLSVRRGDLLDLEIESLGTADAPLVITSSPYDESGNRADSWHEAEDAATAEPVK